MQNKTVVITGGTKGIGEELVKTFAKNGYSVVFSGRHAPTWKISDNMKFVEADVRDRKSHQRLVTEAKKWTGHLDIYINCAGISIWKPIAEIDEEFYSNMMDTNTGGTFWGCQAAAQGLDRGGAIINLSSLAGKRGSANNSAYCASKFAVNGITQSLAKELGPKGIRVNAVCPVYVETKMIHEVLKDPQSPAGGQDVAGYLKSFAQSQAALQRLPLASEIAETCLFLASEGAAAITGQCINVDCGVLPQ